MKLLVCVAIAAFICQANAFTKSDDTEVQDPGVVCADCKGMVQDIKNLIQSDQTQNTTTTAVLSLVCGQPCNTAFYGLCSNVVKSVVPFVTKAVADSIDPEETCISLSLCPPPNGADQDFKIDHIVASAIMKKVSQLLKQY